MAELQLEIDQSHLPRVQEVRQNFAVLEDGVLAHSLQEQEIEQFYMTNIQKNQLVQNDIRVAKRLQDEEEEQREEYSALLRQTSRQMEEQDFEYARLIQEQIQRRAEEARRREMDDQELAKRIQEEEEQRIQSREASSSGSEPHSPHQHHSPVSTRGQRSPSHHSTQFDGPPRGLRTNPRLRSSEGRSFRDPRDCLSEESEESDVFFEHTSARSKTLPPQRDRNQRRLVSHRSFPEYDNGYVRDCSEEDFSERSRMTINNMQSAYRANGEGRCQERELAEVRERRCRRTESVRLPERRRQSFRDGPDKHVRFREDSGRADGRREVWEMLGQVLRERGVPVRLGDSGAPLQIGAAQRREHRGSRHTLYGSEASCSDSQPQPSRAFQRNVTARHSFHGDAVCQRRRRSSVREETQSHDRPNGGVASGETGVSRERPGSRRWKEHRNEECNANDSSSSTHERPAHSGSQRSSDQWDIGPHQRGAPTRSQSLRSRHTPPTVRDRSRLELGELQQVLHDEELARKLQEEEERVSSRNPGPSARPPLPHPDTDFRVAQVVQDEEIARYIQKQEIKSKRRSRELDGPVSWREHRAMMSQHDRRLRERQVPRERLDSEGLPSPSEDCPPEDQPSSPASTLPPGSQIRNIAEELDPTFQLRGPEPLREAQTGSLCAPLCAPLPAAHSGLLEEPTFVPPTKRQGEKPVRPKAKEKRENCKQQ
ncbi:unnamed protein product [Knipowitschia caucasica]|uniref:Coiled-coil domain-containing protein n=1 Tax=Knipowitschia caucasica TaxID=637954 RepID=A0AAV2LZY9_KNICA